MRHGKVNNPANKDSIMKSNSSKDTLFANPHNQLVDFAFTDAVADVFPDMIRRSVPGYDAVIALLGVIARQYIQPDSHVYDLGCSLGASTLSMCQQVQDSSVQFIGVDNSVAMTQRCKKVLQRHAPSANIVIHCADIETIDINNASLVVINFTLQFLPESQRLILLKKVYAGLRKGGALVLSEKLSFPTQIEQDQYTLLHYEFKRANGYSELEISQKRSALDQVMIPDRLETHFERLKQAGFSDVSQWFQSFNFASLLAIK